MDKILILVLASNTYPSLRNEKAIKKTWAKQNHKNIDIVFYKSGNKNKFKNNNLTVLSGKKTSDIGHKTLRAFEWAIKNADYEYIFRTNTSSYINILELQKYIKNLDKSQKFIYNGVIMSLPKNNIRNKVDFVSGAGILFNRNSIELLLSKESDFNLQDWDDVAIGRLFQDNNIKPSSGYRFDIEGNIFKQKIENRHYHYRCRIDNHYGYPRFLEKNVIFFLHDRLTNKNYVESNVKILLYKILFELSRITYIQSQIWNLYNTSKTILKKSLPNSVYINLKKYLKIVDMNIKLRYLKK